MKNFLETTICMEVGKIMTARDYGWSNECTEVCVAALFQGMAIYLGRNKNKDGVVAIELRDFNDQFHFGAYAQYIKQGEDGEGSWTLNYTFDENEIDRDTWTVVNLTVDQVAKGIIKDIVYTEFGYDFKFDGRDDNGRMSEGNLAELLFTTIDVVKSYMAANVTIDPEMSFERYFTMVAKLNADNSVYIGIEPSALMKQYVKDDNMADGVKATA